MRRHRSAGPQRPRVRAAGSLRRMSTGLLTALPEGQDGPATSGVDATRNEPRGEQSVANRPGSKRREVRIPDMRPPAIRAVAGSEQTWRPLADARRASLAVQITGSRANLELPLVPRVHGKQAVQLGVVSSMYAQGKLATSPWIAIHR